MKYRSNQVPFMNREVDGDTSITLRPAPLEFPSFVFLTNEISKVVASLDCYSVFWLYEPLNNSIYILIISLSTEGKIQGPF